MSDEEKKDESPEKEESEIDDGADIKPPEVSLPVPDEFDLELSNSIETNARERAKAERKERKKKRKHPTDAHKPLKRESKGVLGCIFLFLTAVILVLAVSVGYFFYWSVYPYKKAGYEIITNQTEDSFFTINEEPEMESLYLASKIVYDVETTSEKVVFVGGNVTLAGTFEEKVTFRGGKLTVAEGAVFKDELEVYAINFSDKGAVREGEITGSVLSQESD